MASAYLGPECPRPLAVISEYYRTQLQCRLPVLGNWDHYSLGLEYEDKLFNLLHKYLELGTTDSLCYVGDTRHSLHHRIEERFCLLEPVRTMLPGHVHYAETEDNKMLPIMISYVGAEEHFRQMAQDGDKKQCFDRILLYESCRYLTEPADVFRNMAKCLVPGGVLLIVHRPAHLSTLPIFRDAQQRLLDNDVTYMNIINDLQSVKLDVQWELEVIPVRMSKRKWLAMMTDHFPPEMEIMSQTEMLSGLRELTEGMLKYEGETVEFHDRLLFIKATHSDPKNGYPSVQRYGNRQYEPFPAQRDLKLMMALPAQTAKTVDDTSGAVVNK